MSARGGALPRPAAAPDALWVFFDGECGVCSRAVGWALSADRDGLLHPEPVQSAAARERLGEAADARGLEELHVWSEADGIERGVDALAAMLRRLPGHERWARFITSPRVRPWAERAYRWGARHRGWFGVAGCDV